MYGFVAFEALVSLLLGSIMCAGSKLKLSVIFVSFEGEPMSSRSDSIESDSLSSPLATKSLMLIN